MIAIAKLQDTLSDGRHEARLAAMVRYIRDVVIASEPNREILHAIFLDRSRAFVADQTYGQGQIAVLSLRMRDLFARALSVEASGIILAHNHPSGLCRPSLADIQSTKRLIEIGKALDIELVDHLILTHNAVYSMRAGGVL